MEISTYIGSDDFTLFYKIVNQGIDSRLEGFTKSKFTQKEDRFYFDFVESELSILLHRLLEQETDHADLWADNIVYVHYGIEGLIY